MFWELSGYSGCLSNNPPPEGPKVGKIYYPVFVSLSRALVFLCHFLARGVIIDRIYETRSIAAHM
jgi:hypothetical protein